MAQQTAVEWLIEQMPKKLHPHYKKQFEQAKAMEKEHIIDAFDNGCINQDYIGKEYYKEIYKK
jgi:hypothetical protein